MQISWDVIFWLSGMVVAFITIPMIVLQRREPTATLAWVLGIFLLPWVGLLLYILIGRQRLNRQVRRRIARAAELDPLLDKHLENVSDRSSPFASLDKRWKSGERDLRQLSERMGCRPPTWGNEVQLISDAATKYAQLEDAIRGAQDHIHILYYIWQADDSGRRFRDLLIRKAKEGVSVRVLVDGVGSFGLDSFMIPLVQAGGQFTEFLPVSVFSKHWHPNLRNHRKLVVIDGKIAFTGSMNIGDEYVGQKKGAIAQWRDTHLRICGPAVAHLQEVFTEDWHFCTGEDINQERYYPDQQAAGKQLVQIIASGPDSGEQSMQRVFFTAITSARSRIWLTTPYFVPDEAMCVALETAALRGLDVRLLLPARSDQLLVLYAGRSYYEQLLRNGVRIYEYGSGILHAKSLLVDDAWGTAGSANMDMRSFSLNFEVNAAIYGSDFAEQLAKMFERDLFEAQEISLDEVRRKQLSRQMLESLARVMAPVL